MKKSKIQGFTLVELIVVITILAILGTIGFLSFQGYSSDSRDAVRSSDIGNVRTSLGIFNTKVGKYPMPTNITSITYSGAIAWDQGTFGSETFKQLGDINKLPKDPLTENEYTYSVTSNKTEYEISGVYEGSISQNKNILKETYAEGNISGISKIAGTYNGVQLLVETGSTTYTVFSPSIIGDLTSTNLETIVNNNKLVVNGSSKLPSSYTNSKFKDTTINLGIGTNNGGSILLSTGSIGELKSTTQQGKTARIEYVKNLQKVLSGSVISSNYTELIELDTSNTGTTNLSKIDAIAMNVVSGKWSPKINTTIVSTPIANICATQPSYTNATFTTGTPTTVNQEWQSSNNANPCYWTCGQNKVLLGNDCVSESCSGTTPDGTAKLGNATSTAGGTWHYSTTPGVCTYSCNTGYHTEDSGVTCVEDTRSCSITYGVGSQTWNGTSWNTCNVTSCDSNYSISGNSCVANSCASQPSYTNASFITGTPILPNTDWQNTTSGNPCYYACTNGYTGSDCSTAPITQASCTTAGQILTASSTYPGVATAGAQPAHPACNTADIIVCAGSGSGYTLSACNIGSSIAGLTASSYGNYFQWGRNKLFNGPSSSTTQSLTIDGSVGLNASTDTNKFVGQVYWPNTGNNSAIANNWGDVTNTNIARQGPCASGYHVPSSTEGQYLITLLGTSLTSSLKLPSAGARFYDGINYYTLPGANGMYWTSTPSGHAYFIGFYNGGGGDIGNQLASHGMSVRCIKN